MAGIRFLDVHHTWEDWLAMALGIVIALSPWIAERPDANLPMLNAVAVGAAVLLLAESELVDLRRWEESLTLLCGLWLIASPFAYGYTGSPFAIWHFALGGSVALLAAIELWQDWSLTDEQLVDRGR